MSPLSIQTSLLAGSPAAAVAANDFPRAGDDSIEFN
ncbi:hypothetical protein DSL72_002057 [Monilinia vaccinii-corymbosi]|uniref:Uncharacterized protein n=1 Tax=Monilinia vaccinii-corymbosi TaxID=61207 RepID=A0A8A3PBL2_9HELO|nr:hypothetical protein DSL72_002057 [Monilinia vaccinii-corymbosi]